MTSAPRDADTRCAARAARRGDPMLGTAFPAPRVLLVEQPGPWGRRGLRDSRLDGGVATRLEARANRAGIRVQSIRRPGRVDASSERRWALADTRDGRANLVWGTFDHDRELDDLPLDGSTGSPSGEAVYLVCVHGKHDPCCALRGRPVAAALAAIRPDTVWETSHVGGDRFAANVLVLPLGVLYGAVPETSTLELVTATDAGRVVVDLLRGRIGLAPAGQAAVAYAYRELNLSTMSDLAVESIEPRPDAGVTVGLRTPAGPVRVTVSLDTVTVDGLTCANAGPGRYVRYRPTALESDQT